MDGTELLVDLLLVLLFAKVAAEVAERLNLPGVIGEILAGVVVGPSLLGWVSDSEVLAFLGELGVILLLLEVGLEMDLGELGKVGKAALSVAVAGVVLPFAGGYLAGMALGFDGTEALFVGAALTATSVGITARVFGDLRALASVEARTVLGAAVADDVLGLVILTVVVRIVEVGSVSAFDVARLVVVAVGFLVVATVVGLRAVPPIFAWVTKRSSSNGTLIGLVLAFTLAMAQFASLAKLAPIIGAFVAGICLAKTKEHHRIAADLAPLSHVLVPVFFLRIGLEADLGQFGDPKVLWVAAALMVIAVIGKVAATLVMGRAPGDRLLIGIGMLPRGEVGLIFATIGLQQGVFGDDVYASLLLVVLGTTLAAPPLLRARLLKIRGQAEAYRAEPRPAEGWLRIEDGVVDLRAHPPLEEAAVVGIDAALAMERARPSGALLDWAASVPAPVPTSDGSVQARFGALFREGGVRSWRFLVVSGLLASALPELDAAVRRQTNDPFDPDPLGALRWPRTEALHGAGSVPSLVVTLAAVVLDASDGRTDAESVALARALGGRLGLGSSTIDRVGRLVADADVLDGATGRLGISPSHVRRMAVHIGDPAHLDDLVQLTGGEGELVASIRRALGSSGTTDPVSVTARLQAAASLADGGAAARIRTAPAAFALRVPVEEIAYQGALGIPRPDVDAPRIDVRAGHGEGRWTVTVVAVDRMGLLATSSRVVALAGMEVLHADIATWPDGVAHATFEVRSNDAPDPVRLAETLARQVAVPAGVAALAGVRLEFDQAATPWSTVCRVAAGDRFGLLADLAAVFASAHVDIESAAVATQGGDVADVFELTGPGGEKVSDEAIGQIHAAVAHGVIARRRPLRRTWDLVPGA